MKQLITALVILVIAGGVFTACSSAIGNQTGSLEVQEAWARPGAAGGTSAVYFVIENGGEADRLLSASCSAAEKAELHMSRMDGDTMIMEPQENVPLPAGENTEFKPGGLHIMLINLKNDINVGETLPVTLTFEKAGTVLVEAAVREP